MPEPIISGQLLRCPEGRDWMVHQVIKDQHKVVLRRLDKRPREHDLVTKALEPVLWNWERL